MSLELVERWALTELPRLNQAILAGAATSVELVGAVNVVLGEVPEPRAMTPVEAQRLVVAVGLAGVSVARHFQEQDPARKASPELAFDPLVVGTGRRRFLDFFAALADRTGTGHPHRDSYASLVRWNVPTTSVACAGEVLAVLPGVFADGSVRTYTGEASERRFFHLLKESETVERAVNHVLEPLSDAAVGFTEPDGRRRVRLATALLEVLRGMSVDFAALPPELSLRPEFFLDVFRQFAVHWRVGDIPPSGALDPEAIRRDLLLGIALPDYRRHVSRVWPALLARERAELEWLSDRPTLPASLLRGLDLEPDALRSLSAADLTQLLRQYPVLADWYLLLDANARAAGAHLMLSRKFLFRPQRARDAAGLGDRPLVSNRRGTTGMDEGVLERLTVARRNHELAAFRRVSRVELGRIVADERLPAVAELVAAVEVRGAGDAHATSLCPSRVASRLPAPTPAAEPGPVGSSRVGRR